MWLLVRILHRTRNSPNTPQRYLFHFCTNKGICSVGLVHVIAESRKCQDLVIGKLRLRGANSILLEHTRRSKKMKSQWCASHFRLKGQTKESEAQARTGEDRCTHVIRNKAALHIPFCSMSLQWIE